MGVHNGWGGTFLLYKPATVHFYMYNAQQDVLSIHDFKRKEKRLTFATSCHFWLGNILKWGAFF